MQRHKLYLALATFILIFSTLILSKRFTTAQALPDTDPSSTVWSGTYDTGEDDVVNDMITTADGGAVIIGKTKVPGADHYDAWIFKVDASGELVWQKTYGTAVHEEAIALDSAKNGYIILGEIGNYTTSLDLWVMKIDTTGNVQWIKNYDSNHIDNPNSIQSTSDNGYIVSSTSTHATQLKSHTKILKLDHAGNRVWEIFYGNPLDYSEHPLSRVRDIQETQDGHFVLVSCISIPNTTGASWIALISDQGESIWQKEVSNTSPSCAKIVRETSQGDFLLAGPIEAFAFGAQKGWVLKINRDGELIWQKYLSINEHSEALAGVVTNDDAFIIAGAIINEQGDPLRILRLDRNGNVEWNRTYLGSHSTDVNAIRINDNNIFVSGDTNWHSDDGNAWLLKITDSTQTNRGL